MANNNRREYISTLKQKTLRLQNHDYRGPGAYHVIICAQGIMGRDPLFAHPVLHLMLQTHWYDLTRRFPCLRLDEFVIMPDHVHLILWPNKWPHLAPEKGPPALWRIIQALKSRVATDWLAYVNTFHPNWSAQIWQAGYWERVIRVAELESTRQYVHENPFLDDEIYKEMHWTKPLHDHKPLNHKTLGKIVISEILQQDHNTKLPQLLE
jgi:REP element-mobilizing transposase RayT